MSVLAVPGSSIGYNPLRWLYNNKVTVYKEDQSKLQQLLPWKIAQKQGHMVHQEADMRDILHLPYPHINTRVYPS